VKVHAHAVIVGPTSIGRGCEIGKEAVVTRSVLLSHCLVGAGARVDSSLLADDVDVPSGVEVSDTVQLESLGEPRRVRAMRLVRGAESEPPTVTKPTAARFLARRAR
jgi:NDP-sugar pyrophosphorylase family protein